jgi:hypothetical protein
MIFVGQRSLDRAIKEYVEHYHDERSTPVKKWNT